MRAARYNQVLDRMELLTKTGSAAQVNWVWEEARRQYVSAVDSYPGEHHHLADYFENALDMLRDGYEGSPK